MYIAYHTISHKVTHLQNYYICFLLSARITQVYMAFDMIFILYLFRLLLITFKIKPKKNPEFPINQNLRLINNAYNVIIVSFRENMANLHLQVNRGGAVNNC